MKKLISIILLTSLLFLCACTGKEPPVTTLPGTSPDISVSVTPAEGNAGTVDLMEGVAGDSRTIASLPLPGAFVSGTADFGIKLLQKSMAADKNYMVSPYSVLSALAMTANGAKGDTLAEMQAVLCPGRKISALNKDILAYRSLLTENKNVTFTDANSIWFRDNENVFNVNNDFLRINANYFNASAYKSPFDNGTVSEMNKWVRTKTDGMIDGIIDEIDSASVMYLINAIAFKAKWSEQYADSDVYMRSFTDINGDSREVKMMSGCESRYIDYGGATGFIKDYEGGNFAFVALLPNEGTSLPDYVNSLTGDKFIKTVLSVKDAVCYTKMPIFKSEYSINLNNALIDMGMPLAFSDREADLSLIGSAGDRLFISAVEHKTFISVNTEGTEAAAVTAVTVKATGALLEAAEVTLDRPFVYAVIDTETNLPVFIGATLFVEV